MRLTFAGYQGDRSVHTRAGRIFCDLISAKAGSSAVVKFDENIVDSGYKAADLLSKTESGEIDGCYFSSSYLAGRVPELGLFDQHFQVPDRQHAYAVLDGALGERLKQEVEKKTGFKVLGYWDNGVRHISNAVRPIKSPSDCIDLKLRTLANDNHQRVFGSLGFQPMKIDVRDLPQAVISGKVDAQENPLTNIYNFNLHKTHKYITLTQHLLGVALLLFNKDTVDAWPDSFKDNVSAAAREATKQQRLLAEEEDTICSAALKSDGCELIELSETQRIAFRTVTESEVNVTRSEFSEEFINLFESDLASVSD
jgi:C4-dicarboxylate-binding protein DctP